MHIGFLENVKDSEYLEDLCIDGKIILEWIVKEIGWNCVDWIHLSQGKDQ